MEILDIHTHHAAPQAQAVIALRLGADGCLPVIDPAQRYSAGIHPWDTEAEISDAAWHSLEQLAEQHEIVAIGECGIDLTPKGGPLFRQLTVFKHHIELAERLNKPMVIHDVKGHDIIAGARRDMQPTQQWAIHGFRRKPEVAQMLLRAGCWLSFGPMFNPDALRVTPEERILAETDDSDTSIQEVIARMSAAVDHDLTETIAANTRRFLNI